MWMDIKHAAIQSSQWRRGLPFPPSYVHVEPPIGGFHVPVGSLRGVGGGGGGSPEGQLLGNKFAMISHINVQNNYRPALLCFTPLPSLSSVIISAFSLLSRPPFPVLSSCIPPPLHHLLQSPPHLLAVLLSGSDRHGRGRSIFIKRDWQRFRETLRVHA